MSSFCNRAGLRIRIQLRGNTHLRGVAMWEEKEILITVKTYPHPQPQVKEVVCTAGIDRNGEWIRLFPIPFRYLDNYKKYKKYQWISVTTKRATDHRKESFTPRLDTLKIISDVADWDDKCKIVLSTIVYKSMDELQMARKQTGISLCTFKPSTIDDITCKKGDIDWNPKQREIMRQQFLGEEIKKIEKIPYEFRYKFTCIDKDCKGHEVLITDWELGALYLKVKANFSEEDTVRLIKQKFLGDLCSPKRDTYFYLGTTIRHPQNWIVLGVFSPPKQQQPTLFNA